MIFKPKFFAWTKVKIGKMDVFIAIPIGKKIVLLCDDTYLKFCQTNFSFFSTGNPTNFKFNKIESKSDFPALL